ncbi:hypothetical protein ADL15_43715 [Actinoplanes awajinensis subsp. mycoplanecinus]|uniref:Antibiotic biosynthesis monooxygenase n=1 Tax=Actinoplanes awajinensis subsp. mycoplanecinus TaxID=135947 RepID=A0A101JCT0_9ACTN|nr:hypothetical protein ADL15_43715 [Actinoplanes awajinensis subsp. mycoplanecinus]
MCLDGDQVMFTSLSFFTDMDAVRAFAGDDPDQAVLEEPARRALIRWDDRVTHHEVTVDLRSEAEGAALHEDQQTDTDQH